jgi:hypothetical protein
MNFYHFLKNNKSNTMNTQDSILQAFAQFDLSNKARDTIINTINNDLIEHDYEIIQSEKNKKTQKNESELESESEPESEPESEHELESEPEPVITFIDRNKLNEFVMSHVKKTKYNNWFNHFVNKSNESNTKTIIQTEKIPCNSIITSATQNNKTKFILSQVKNFDNTFLTWVCTANKTDQLQQLFSRTITQCPDFLVLKVTDPKFLNKIKNALQMKKKVICFFLDNFSQISKVNSNIVCLRTMYLHNIKTMVFCLDEGDLIAKSNITNKIVKSNEQMKAHVEWVLLMDSLKIIKNSDSKILDINIKRIFITATPEAIMMLYDIERCDVIYLQYDKNYVSYKNIITQEIDTDTENTSVLIDIINKENTRIINENKKQVILISSHVNVESDEKSHKSTMFLLRDKLPKITTSTYNGEGITCYTPDKSLKLILKRNKYLKEYNKEMDLFTFKKDLSIAEFYSLCKMSKVMTFITIGKNLMCRGISFVSLNDEDDEEYPLCATVMVYLPGKTITQVGLTQAIGRILGTSNPEIQSRYLYTSTDVITSYNAYNKNQEKLMEQLESGTELTRDIIKNIEFDFKSKQKLDRPALKLEPFKIKIQNIEQIDGEIDGVKLVNLHKWLSENNTIVAKIINFLYTQSNVVSVNTLQTMINYTETRERFINNLSSGRAIHSDNGKLWSYLSDCVILNPNIKQYIQEHNLL